MIDDLRSIRSIGLHSAFVNEGVFAFITGRREPKWAEAVKEVSSNVIGIRSEKWFNSDAGN